MAAMASKPNAPDPAPACTVGPVSASPGNVPPPPPLGLVVGGFVASTNVPPPPPPLGVIVVGVRVPLGTGTPPSVLPFVGLYGLVIGAGAVGACHWGTVDVPEPGPNTVSTSTGVPCSTVIG